MPNLKHTEVYRGGMTAQHLTIETSECSFHANASGRAMDLSFKLASKGGGTTSVLLRIGIDDLPQILEAIATAMPESVGVLSDCAALANKKNLEQLTEARRVQTDAKAMAEALVAKLVVVEEFVSQKYNDAPAGEDEREATVQSQLDEVVSSLRLLS